MVIALSNLWITRLRIAKVYLKFSTLGIYLSFKLIAHHLVIELGPDMNNWGKPDEPHTSGTALQRCVYVSLLVAIYCKF